MKDKFHIDHIRRLLHKYYEGESAPEEEQFLEAFFHDTPEWEIPEDMEVDRRLFTSMASLHPAVSEMEIPCGLFERISEISVSNEAIHTDKLQRNKASRTVYFLVAACACLILPLGIRLMTNQKHIHTEASEYASESHAKLPKPPSKASTEEETSPDTSKTQGASTSHPYQGSNKTADNAGELNRLEDGFIEITDPVEAEKIVMEIGMLLASNTRQTNQAIQHLEKTVDQYKETTKSILR